MRRSISFIAAAALALAACGDDGDGGTQEQTEQAAVDAAVRAIRATFDGDADGVIAFANEACRETIDKSEVELGLLFLRGFVEEGDFDLDDVEITGTIEDFDGDSATVELTYVAPESAGDVEDLLFTSDEVDLIYENGRWVSEDCEFGDDTSDEDTAAARTAELEALGVAGTQDDPAPAGAALTVGNGFRLIVGDYTLDAAAEIEAETGFAPFLEEGESVARLQYSYVYEGADEPASAADVGFDVFGADGVGLAANGCAFPGEPDFGDRVFTGAVASSSVCITGTPAQLAAPLVAARAGFGEADLFIDPLTPTATADTFTAVSGPAPDGDATDDRTSPTPLGTAVDLDNGWTLTIDAVELDGTARAAAEADFITEPPAGRAFTLVDVTLDYAGDEAASPFQLTLVTVGDDNIGVGSDCSFGGLPGELERFNDLLPGTSVSGTICFETAADQHPSLVLAATSDSFDQDWEYFALR